MEQKTELKTKKDMAWVKSLLNNIPLLKWVRKYSADNLLKDNELAEKYGIAVNEDTITVSDDTITKLIVTNSRFNGKEFVRFNMKQLGEVVKLLGDEGELIVSSENNNEMFIQINDTVIVVCPLAKDDKGEVEK